METNAHFANLVELEEKLKKNFWRKLVKGDETLKRAYTQKMNNARKSNLYSKNANYKALFNRVNTKFRNATKSENRPNIRYRRQEGGTCWFHSIVNGLLLSARPRSILKHMAQNVIADQRRNYTFCPMRNAPRLLFWKYIKHRLEGYGGINAAYKNVNVIKSSGVRSPFLRLRRAPKNNYEGGTQTDVYNFYKKMFPNGLFILKKYELENIPHSLPDGYTLTHGDVSVWYEPKNGGDVAEGHAVAGYLTPSGKYKIYDSGSDKVIDYDWTKKQDASYYPDIIHMKVIAIFTKNIIYGS